MTSCRPLIRLSSALLAASLYGAVAPAGAEKADRSKPMVVEADRSGTVDLQRAVLVYAGNVVISQGTLMLRAERIELRETPEGYRAATATGVPGKPALWRQRRDGVDETVEGSADRIELDGQADTLRFIGNSAVRRLRGSVVADEISGGTIVWDNTSEVFRVEGGSATPVNPTGRVRAILSPRAASAPPAGSPATLQPSRGLEERR
ncbi:lipopolysaccharide transport periplasmic protein LptA [Rubrivivax sp. A210]|uniref:lipopolysaccharide transport periplasmic protein LptA n=1 Tax=Rubrivivax sp. A210 TaxID=2772301 RepID=UPI00191B89F3|nr:lipopolysaccharide transport periplasmic protein LptA [Rubrivivax sp. A210]